MAMSLKKIGAIAVGGAMVASALASGAMAATTSGDVSAFMKDAVKDGQPNVNIVVGENAATADVVSASDIAAKIGSMAYKTGTVEDGSADIKVSAKAESDEIKDLKAAVDEDGTTKLTKAFVMAAADNDYTGAPNGDSGILGGFTDAGEKIFDIGSDDSVNNDASRVYDLEDLPTLMKVDDIDPEDWYNSNDDDALEVIAAVVSDDSGTDFSAGKYKIDSDEIVYASLAMADDSKTGFTYGAAAGDYINLGEGIAIPFLGSEYRIVKLDTDDDIVYVGEEAKTGVLGEGDEYDVGNGYSVKILSILKDGTGTFKADVQILKDGKVVAEKFDKVAGPATQLKLVYKDVGVVVNSAWMNVGESKGYADLLITKNTKALSLGDEYVTDWEAYGVTVSATGLALTDKVGTNLVGIALKYTGDKIDNLKSDKDVDILNYIKLNFDKDDKTPARMHLKFKMDTSKDVTLCVSQKVTALNTEVKLSNIAAEAQQAVPVTAPIAKLDSEVTLDTADKNLILVGGPVVNKLAEALQTAGKITIDNTSPATLAVVGDAANGNDVLVVAGGDRDATRAAALDLIKDY